MHILQIKKSYLLYCIIHLFYFRSIIYPFLQKQKPHLFVTAFSAFVYCTFNGYIQVSFLWRHCNWVAELWDIIWNLGWTHRYRTLAMTMVEQQYWELGYSVPGILIGVYEIIFNLGKTLVLEIYCCIQPFSHYVVIPLVARREISLPIIMNDRIILKWMVSSSAGRSWIFWNQYNIYNL